MNILLATSAAVPTGGGIASYNQELCRLLGKYHNLYLLTDSHENEVNGYCEVYNNYGKAKYSYSYCQKLIKKINESEYDLIINSRHSIMPYIAPFVTTPIITVAHFVNGIQADNAGYNTDYLNTIIALSNYSKQYLEKEFKILDTQKVKVVYNFVSDNTQKYNSYKEFSKELTIVFPGGTSVQKSVDVILDTVYRLKLSAMNFKFVWLGDTTLPSAKKSLLRIEKTTQLISTDKRILFTGKVSREEAMQYIASANIFLLPSRGEGCPMTLLEAMREGCIPVVSDSHHGSRELLEISKCGEIVPQGDSEKLYQVIKKIIENHNEYINCYKKTFEFSKTYLSQDIWRSKMSEIILDATQKPKKVIKINLIRFYKSMIPYRYRIIKNRVKTMCLSAFVRIKIDFIYLKWRNKGSEYLE